MENWNGRKYLKYENGPVLELGDRVDWIAHLPGAGVAVITDDELWWANDPSQPLTLLLRLQTGITPLRLIQINQSTAIIEGFLLDEDNDFPDDQVGALIYGLSQNYPQAFRVDGIVPLEDVDYLEHEQGLVHIVFEDGAAQDRLVDMVVAVGEEGCLRHGSDNAYVHEVENDPFCSNPSQRLQAFANANNDLREYGTIAVLGAGTLSFLRNSNRLSCRDTCSSVVFVRPGMNQQIVKPFPAENTGFSTWIHSSTSPPNGASEPLPDYRFYFRPARVAISLSDGGPLEVVSFDGNATAGLYLPGVEVNCDIQQTEWCELIPELLEDFAPLRATLGTRRATVAAGRNSRFDFGVRFADLEQKVFSQSKAGPPGIVAHERVGDELVVIGADNTVWLYGIEGTELELKRTIGFLGQPPLSPSTNDECTLEVWPFGQLYRGDEVVSPADACDHTARYNFWIGRILNYNGESVIWYDGKRIRNLDLQTNQVTYEIDKGLFQNRLSDIATSERFLIIRNARDLFVFCIETGVLLLETQLPFDEMSIIDPEELVFSNEERQIYFNQLRIIEQSAWDDYWLRAGIVENRDGGLERGWNGAVELSFQ